MLYKKIIFLFLLSIAILTADAQHDNLSNLSAEWVRTSARNAALDAGDIVVYNPAGIVRSDEGFQLNIGNQSLFRKPSHSYDFGFGAGEQSFTQESADMYLPNFYASYNRKSWAIFTGLFVSGGGASLDYPTGSVTTDMIGMQVLSAAQGAYGMYEKQYLKASSFYLTSTLGISLTLTDRISVAAAGRFLDARNKMEGGMTFTQSPFGLPDAPFSLKSTSNATGAGAVLSLMMKAGERSDITIRYESPVKLDFKTKTQKDDFGIITDGEKHRRDLPGLIACGISFSASQNVKLYGDFNYFMQKNADWDTYSTPEGEKNYADAAGDAYGVSAAITWNPSDKLMLSMGGGFSDFKFNDMPAYYTNMGSFETGSNDNKNINAGFSFKITSGLTFTAGYMHVFYDDQEIALQQMQPVDIKVKSQNQIDVIAFGINLKM